MTIFGILCPAVSGHLNPMIALGTELQNRGHRVIFFQIPDLKSKLILEGFEFEAIGQSDYPLGTFTQFQAELGRRKGIEATFYWHEERQRISGLICRDAPGALKTTGVEALIVDQNEPSGLAVAELLSLPFVTVCNGLILNREASVPPIFTSWRYQKSWWMPTRNQIVSYLGDRSISKYNTVLAQYRREWNLPELKSPDILYANSKLAQISQQPPAFDFPRTALPDYFHYVGPLRQFSSQNFSFPFERLTGQPLIYASLGTLMKSFELFYCIAAACEDLDVQLVITHGGSMNERDVQQLPGNPLVVSYAPQLKLLKSARLTITHAGLNTVLDSLTNGVPLVAIPIAFEQPAIGARIKWTGVGEAILAKSLTIAKLRTAVQKVLLHDSYSQNALKIKNSIEQAGGVKRAAAIIEQAITTGKPVLSTGNLSS